MVKRQLKDTWGEDSIQSKIDDLEQSLKDTDNKPKRRRIFARLGELKAALRGETTVGGNIAPPENPKPKRVRQAEPKETPKINEAMKNVLCLCCRQFGHRLNDCPEKKKLEKAEAAANATEEPLEDKVEEKTVHPFRAPRTVTTIICYNCGSNEHSLKNCQKPRPSDGSMPFATCFVCKQSGHLSSACDQNLTGIYPQGGGCRTCGSVMHLQRDCKIYLAKQEEEREKEEIAKVNSKKDEVDDELGGNTNFSTEHKSRANWGNRDSRGFRQNERPRGGYNGGNRGYSGGERNFGGDRDRNSGRSYGDRGNYGNNRERFGGDRNSHYGRNDRQHTRF